MPEQEMSGTYGTVAWGEIGYAEQIPTAHPGKAVLYWGPYSSFYWGQLAWGELRAPDVFDIIDSGVATEKLGDRILGAIDSGIAIESLLIDRIIADMASGLDSISARAFIIPDSGIGQELISFYLKEFKTGDYGSAIDKVSEKLSTILDLGIGIDALVPDEIKSILDSAVGSDYWSNLITSQSVMDSGTLADVVAERLFKILDVLAGTDVVDIQAALSLLDQGQGVEMFLWNVEVVDSGITTEVVLAIQQEIEVIDVMHGIESLIHAWQDVIIIEV